jgi:DNA repair protein RecO (recombination protein O)
LVTVSNCDIIESFFELQKDLRVNFTLAYFAELIEGFSPLRARDDLLFRLLSSVLQALKSGGDIDFLTAYFESWLLKINGVLPELKNCKKCGKDIRDLGWLSAKKDGVYCDACASYKKEKASPVLGSFVRWIKRNPPAQEGKLPFSQDQIKAIRKALEKIIVFHLEREPKSLAYLK